ncbi:uncharacterized protein MELLADRAFT_105347 [Melampsora larici-populina 98AG31]|uniref:Uncharacterized protein n=1 Tax=Melampsora larici-populina (strain 98AG31 / pathotype 3-4-7) TaxID=747676 RepID=F4RHU4_MELLP|nr:uncharacterized protein MELLADRAFT_105347 [Melampsora larici-populina 98AG31]EGG08075.1 hypothetical protein MELLADRAFT_105347 [Melampsora larici-populina 98AG31]
MPTRNPLESSEDSVILASTPSGDYVIDSPNTTSTSSVIETPITKSPSTGSASVHGSVEPAGDEDTRREPILVGNTSGQMVPTSRTIYKVRARPAVRHTTSEVVLGAGSVICISVPHRVSNFRLDSPSKRAAFLYHLEGFYDHGSLPTYVPDGVTGFTEAIVVYEMGRKVDISKTRDINDWSFRELQGDGVVMPYEGIARFHARWSSSATSGREHALEIVNAHSYVGSMLQLFKGRLRKLWNEQSSANCLALELREWFLRASALHVGIEPG